MNDQTTGQSLGQAELTDRYHYQVIGRAIEIIDAAPGPLTLEEIAADIGLSPAHFQRVFSRWAGVSPKRYQQYLTLDHARKLLQSRHSTLETAHLTGLSGVGRLHDLFLRWEAMSPGDYARGGAGLRIRTGWFESPFGDLLAMGTDRGICGLGLAAQIGREATEADLRQRWPKAEFAPDARALAPWVDAALTQSGEARMHLIGGPFQIKVWEALLNVPDGHVTTYSDIAAAIGHPSAVRAVGTAVGRNPISWLIPCHRALRKSGAMGGYHWGMPVKRALLAWESARWEA
ncbi:methylated-DNA--[protein]-cysteine S-methyltransferase [Poseidonocella sedimentorum]|uniref:methylated-DNA--[protein]-cysteine S-methyltransferase n=1 Tax=Poseidonocella sedimentorum TaxID=871652 RepID=A0A1I6D7D2_9RHOB|nr:bifunctional helix-turn-helix domain-containing protein/methylated-DNA--[protein]-cysteine S-methyltransferase [Poseidonocella sedimentorum]SFR01281.1 AraC family transcriptional regulator, regulatory protein of adaptative response / methylated-DNA-[protein]-cysteine methyltransferase [Poseidonocella sedimentorum]